MTQRYVDPRKHFSSLPSGEPGAEYLGPHNRAPTPSPTQTSELTPERNVWFQFHLLPSYSLSFCLFLMPHFSGFSLAFTYSLLTTISGVQPQEWDHPSDSRINLSSHKTIKRTRGIERYRKSFNFFKFLLFFF